eukprot:6294412-Prymnesium_polylepis.1
MPPPHQIAALPAAAVLLSAPQDRGARHDLLQQVRRHAALHRAQQRLELLVGGEGPRGLAAPAAAVRRPLALA